MTSEPEAAPIAANNKAIDDVRQAMSRILASLPRPLWLPDGPTYPGWEQPLAELERLRALEKRLLSTGYAPPVKQPVGY